MSKCIWCLLKSTACYNTKSLLCTHPFLLITRPFLATHLIQRKCWALPIPFCSFILVKPLIDNSFLHSLINVPSLIIMVLSEVTYINRVYIIIIILFNVVFCCQGNNHVIYKAYRPFRIIYDTVIASRHNYSLVRVAMVIIKH